MLFIWYTTGVTLNLNIYKYFASWIASLLSCCRCGILFLSHRSTGILVSVIFFEYVACLLLFGRTQIVECLHSLFWLNTQVEVVGLPTYERMTEQFKEEVCRADWTTPFVGHLFCWHSDCIHKTLFVFPSFSFQETVNASLITWARPRFLKHWILGSSFSVYVQAKQLYHFWHCEFNHEEFKPILSKIALIISTSAMAYIGVST